MAHIEATTLQQVSSFLQSNGGVAVVDCHATWCGPCKAIAPYVHQKNTQTGIPLIKVDVDQSPELSQFFGIKCMPTFIVVKLTGNTVNIVHKKQGGGQVNVNQVFDTAAKNK